ncbi:MAG: hypothetical protein Q9M17_09975 [Mariprofundus sp.]|nr:hypothetical protein [Mariprofundus sp.]
MTSSLTTNQQSHASWRILLTTFAVALLLFVAMRWQPEAWIQSQINIQSQKYGIDISYKALQTDGFTIQLDQAVIQTMQMPQPVKLDRLILSPAWSSLFSGNPAVQIHLVWIGQQASAIAIQRTDSMELQALHAELDIAALQPLLSKSLPLPLNLGGIAKINGNILLNAINAQPLLGKIDINWNTAVVDMPPMKLPLGDYALSLQTDDAKKAWSWDLSGGTALTLTGKGKLNTSAPNPAAWTIDGMVQAKADQKEPNLSALLGNENRQFSLSGNISQPRLQPL